MNYLGKYLKKRLKELKMSEREVSAKCGISHSYLNQIIKGVNPSTNKTISPTLNTLEKLAAGFGVSVEQLQKIARGCTAECSELYEKEIGNYSPEVLKQINDFQNFMTEIGLDRTQRTEEEWNSFIGNLKDLIKKSP